MRVHTNSHAAIMQGAMGVPAVMGQYPNVPFFRVMGKSILLDGYTRSMSIDVTQRHDPS